MSRSNANVPAPNLRREDETHRPLRTNGLEWLALALLALALVILVAYSNWHRVSETNAEAVRLRDSLSSLRQVLISLENAETGQRGYLLTNKQDYLQPYLDSAATIDQELADLKAHWALADDRNKLAQLERAAKAKMTELQSTLDVRNSQGPTAALAIVNTNQGKQSMDQARLLAAALEKKITARMDAKSTAVTEQARTAGLISVAASLTLFILLALANLHLRKQREMAEAANRAKSEFLASMSHELRTPLNAIIGYSEMLAEEAQDSGQTPFVSDLAKIQAAGRHLLMLINSVLDLSKIEAGRMDLYLETTGVQSLVNEVIAVVRPLADKNRNSLDMHIAPDVGSMHTDQTKVRQSLYNLLSNACKFTENGRVTLRVRRETVNNAETILFIVEDTGVGMTAEEIKRIFEPFTQADASTSRRFGGTGLGLTLSRRFVQMMGGEISVESKPNAGSSFSIRLPANLAAGSVSATPQSAAVSAPQGVAGEGVVLVIDDEPAIHDLLGRTLAKNGFKVQSARSGEEGLRLARKIRPTAITLDVMMPGMDGWTVLTALKSDPELCDIPVLMLTIVDNENVGYALGATDYLTKPLDRDRLITILSRYRGAGPSDSALLVDDDENSRVVMCRALEAEGWKVQEAENGRVALEHLDRSRPNIILLDLMMPEMDGFEFLDELRRRPEAKTIPVIVVTAKDLTPEDRARLNGDVSRILMKGAFQTQDLLTEVGQLVLTRVRAQTGAQTSIRPSTPARS